jgi:hypothetical protein
MITGNDDDPVDSAHDREEGEERRHEQNETHFDTEYGMN